MPGPGTEQATQAPWDRQPLRILRAVALATCMVTIAWVVATAQQQPPDCRSGNTPVGSECVYPGTQLPVQRYLGDITLPSSDHVRMTGPADSMVVPSEHGRPLRLGLLGGIQTETFGGYTSGVLRTAGVQMYARTPLSRSVWLDLRGTSVAFGGSNHTQSIQAGPRFEHALGRTLLYGEALAGAGHQYTWDLPVSGVVGLAYELPRSRFTIIPFEGTYTYAAAQLSTRLANPQKGRLEAFGGVEYRTGGRRE